MIVRYVWPGREGTEQIKSLCPLCDLCGLCVEMIACCRDHGLNQSVGVEGLVGRRVLRRVLARLDGLVFVALGVGFFPSTGVGVGVGAGAGGEGLAPTGSVAPASLTHAAQPPSRACTCV